MSSSSVTSSTTHVISSSFASSTLINSATSSNLVPSPSSSSTDNSVPTPSTLAASVESVAETLPKYLIAGGVALGVVILLGLLLSWWKLKVKRNRHFDEEDHYWFEKRHERLSSTAPSTPRRGSDQSDKTLVGIEEEKEVDSPSSQKTLVGPIAPRKEDTPNSTSPSSTSPDTLGPPRSSSFLGDEPYVLVSRSTTSSPASPVSSTLLRDGAASLPLPSTTGVNKIPRDKKHRISCVRHVGSEWSKKIGDGEEEKHHLAAPTRT